MDWNPIVRDFVIMNVLTHSFLRYFDLMWLRRVLLKHIWSSIAYAVYRELNNLIQELNVCSCVNSRLFWKDVRRHHGSFVADNSQNHDSRRIFFRISVGTSERFSHKHLSFFRLNFWFWSKFFPPEKKQIPSSSAAFLSFFKSHLDQINFLLIFFWHKLTFPRQLRHIYDVFMKTFLVVLPDSWKTFRMTSLILRNCHQ